MRQTTNYSAKILLIFNFCYPRLIVQRYGEFFTLPNFLQIFLKKNKKKFLTQNNNPILSTTQKKMKKN